MGNDTLRAHALLIARQVSKATKASLHFALTVYARLCAARNLAYDDVRYQRVSILIVASLIMSVITSFMTPLRGFAGGCLIRIIVKRAIISLARIFLCCV
jgi:hypothetical protein